MENAVRATRQVENTNCSWCGAKILAAEAEQLPVCDKCLRLLKGAGVSEEEIFGVEHRAEDEGSPSRSGPHRSGG